MTTKPSKIVKFDNKGRVALGRLAKGIDFFRVTQDKHNRIILEPFIEISPEEKWLYKNKIALIKISRGLKDSFHNRVKDREDFTKYINDDELA